MPGLVPGIHYGIAARVDWPHWIAGTSPAMTMAIVALVLK